MAQQDWEELLPLGGERRGQHLVLHKVATRAEPFSFEGLAAATEGFADFNKLGEGSFGTVYRGVLFDGRVVAIKRADRRNLGKTADKQNAFEAELAVMSRLHHKHLVNLVGYCDDRDEMILVYEYLPNGTLSDHLHDRLRPSRRLFSWKVRIRMALQAARGIEYLHAYAVPPVIHRDIKTSNILLDSKWSVRVSDFGLSLIFPSPASREDEAIIDLGSGAGTSRDYRHVTTRAAGTVGYMDPEYYRFRHLTTKSDVYSFGIVILELLTGKRAIFRRNNSHISVVDYAMPAIEADDLTRILDPRGRMPNMNEIAALKVMAEVGQQAVRLRGRDRPSMTEIISRLEHAVTLCRPRHAPLPVFGAHIGSTSETSPSPSLPSSTLSDRPLQHHRRRGTPVLRFEEEFAEDVEAEAGEGDYTTGTDVTQIGSQLSSSQALILQEFLQGIADDFDRQSSDLRMSFESEEPDEFRLLRRETGGAGRRRPQGPAAGIVAIGTGSSSPGGAASRYYGTGQGLGSGFGSSSQRQWQELRESWQQQQQRSRLRTSDLGFSSSMFGESSEQLGGLAGGAYEGGGEGSAVRATEPTDYSDYGIVIDDPSLLRQGSTLAGFANFSGLGPPEDVIPAPEPPPPEEQQLGGGGRMRGLREQRRLWGSTDEPQPAGGSMPTAAEVMGVREFGSEHEGSVETFIGDVDIEEFLAQFPGERVVARSPSYAGFSIHHDLDDLMTALHALQEEQEQGELQMRSP